MKKAMKIHKQDAGVFTLCTGKNESESKLSYSWGKVTCKHCLNLKGKKKPTSYSNYISDYLRVNGGYWS